MIFSRFLSRGQLVFDQQFAFEYFLNYKGMSKITWSMFELTGMIVVEVEKNELLLEIQVSEANAANSVYGRFKKKTSGATLYRSTLSIRFSGLRSIQIII